VDQSPAEWFSERGFRLSFSSHSEDEVLAVYSKAAGWSRKELRRHLKDGTVGTIFASLEGRNGLTLTACGTGTSEDDAAEQAMRRWRGEQGD
jgi:hypothetical protein